jgi:hypothetical protein
MIRVFGSVIRVMLNSVLCTGCTAQVGVNYAGSSKGGAKAKNESIQNPRPHHMLRVLLLSLASLYVRAEEPAAVPMDALSHMLDDVVVQEQMTRLTELEAEKSSLNARLIAIDHELGDMKERAVARINRAKEILAEEGGEAASRESIGPVLTGSESDSGDQTNKEATATVEEEDDEEEEEQDE